MPVDFHSWDTYFQAGVAAGITWLIKTAIAQGKAQVAMETTMKYYVERQTQDALYRLDKGNPAPPKIVDLARRHIKGTPLLAQEHEDLISWLEMTGRGKNPVADTAEQSAALQLLTGMMTRPRFAPPKKWWRWVL